MKTMRSRLLAPAALGALFMLAATVALQAAAALPPGGVLLNPVVGTPSYTTGFVPANFSNLVASANEAITGDFTGTVASFVFQDPTTKELAFAYQFTNTTKGTVSLPDIVLATIGNLSSPWLGTDIFDAGANGDGTSTAAPNAPNWTDGNPYSLTRGVNANGAGVTIAWEVLNKGTLLNPGDKSALIWFATRTKDFQKGDVGLIDSGLVGKSCAYVPRIPEPATLVLWGLGFGALGLVAWRRKR